jgi:SulP family sulfate permease
VLLATFGLTLVRDLTFGIVAGCMVAAMLALVGRGVAEEGD